MVVEAFHRCHKISLQALAEPGDTFSLGKKLHAPNAFAMGAAQYFYIMSGKIEHVILLQAEADTCVLITCSCFPTLSCS